MLVRPDSSTHECRRQETRSFAELLIDCEEDRVLRPVLVGMLREAPVHTGFAVRSPG